MSRAPRFIVGIDLGTTHTVAASADAAARENPTIEVFEVAQQVAPGEVEARPMLPSARYHAAAGELSDAALAIARPDHEGEEPEGALIVGAGALALGAKVPSRLVTSAKSWLSHGSIDRLAPILPWGVSEEVHRTSPVDASASYLRRVRLAWDEAHEGHPLAAQEVVLTVPASFDEGARELTLEAARRAGIPKVRLVEEPTAAFHHFLDRHREGVAAALAGVALVLVVDVGGGTTDFTLVRVELRESGPRLTRLAVGDHLMLGGDNVDRALAHLVETRLSPGSPLGPARHLELLQRVRVAKETLLGPNPPEFVRVSVLGSGSRLVGGTLACELRRDEVEQVFADGFFPIVDASARPERRRTGLVEIGLPFVADPAITRHLVAFLARHAGLVRETIGESHATSIALPDAVLFNGGVFHAGLARERVVALLSRLRGGDVRVLEGDDPDRAVALGAVAYGLARRGVGTKVGGGSSRSFFLRLEGERLVCILPRGSEEGETVRLRRPFSLKLGKPVRFRVVSTPSDVRYVGPGDEDVFDPERFEELPPIAAVLGDAGESGELRVELEVALTEVGTLELSFVSGEGEGARRFKLELSLRSSAGGESEVARVTRLHPRFAEAVDEIRHVFGKASVEADARDVKRLRIELERILGPRDTWETPLLRELFGALLAGVKNRRRSADHERVFFNLAGYCLRPGFGYPLDAWRAEQLAPLVAQEVQFVNESHNWAELWTMLRRVAGGLSPAVHATIADLVEPYLEPPSDRPRPRPKGPKRLGLDEMIALAGVLEHLEPPRKIRLANHLLARLALPDPSPRIYWALGRIGGRVPVFGSAHRVVPPAVAEAWIAPCLTATGAFAEPARFAAASIARVSGDRARDLAEPVRAEVVRRLEAASASPHLIASVREATRLDAVEERKVFGESLPPGLRLVDD